MHTHKYMHTHIYTHIHISVCANSVQSVVSHSFQPYGL